MGYSNFFTVAAFGTLFAVSPTLAIDITVDANAGIKKISPYLYGRNIDKISDGDAEVTEEESAFINQMLEAGIHMLRANNGNNATRYNWRHKMTVHPDWYNNVSTFPTGTGNKNTARTQRKRSTLRAAAKSQKTARRSSKRATHRFTTWNGRPILR